MAKDVFFNDDLSDLVGTGQPVERKELPSQPEFVRIRESVPEFVEQCPKCRGTGRFTSYSGRQLGPCFACKGKGSNTYRTSPEDRAAARQRTVEAKAENRQEFKVQIGWLTAKLAGKTDWMKPDYLQMLKDFLAKLNNGLLLSDRQMAVINNGMARDAERQQQWDAQRRQVQAAKTDSAVVDAAKIVAALQAGKASGLIWVNLRFNGIVMQEAKNFPGVVYVKHSSRLNSEGKKAYLGKIAEGRFMPSRECLPEDKAAVVLICEDPLAAAKVYGNVTGRCCVCNLALTNKQSIEEGIGPICSSRMNWTKGGLRVQVSPNLPDKGGE